MRNARLEFSSEFSWAPRRPRAALAPLQIPPSQPCGFTVLHKHLPPQFLPQDSCPAQREGLLLKSQTLLRVDCREENILQEIPAWNVHPAWLAGGRALLVGFSTALSPLFQTGKSFWVTEIYFLCTSSVWEKISVISRKSKQMGLNHNNLMQEYKLPTSSFY